MYLKQAEKESHHACAGEEVGTDSVISKATENPAARCAMGNTPDAAGGDLGSTSGFPPRTPCECSANELAIRRLTWNLLERQRSPWVRAHELPDFFRSWDLAHRCTRGGWIVPIIKGPRRTIYRLADVILCLLRIEAGELPVARSRNRR